MTCCDTPRPPDTPTKLSAVGATTPDEVTVVPLPTVKFTVTCWESDPTLIVTVPEETPDPLAVVFAVTVT